MLHLDVIYIQFSSFSSQYPNLVSSMDLEALTRGEARMVVFGSDAVPSRGINFGLLKLSWNACDIL